MPITDAHFFPKPFAIRFATSVEQVVRCSSLIVTNSEATRVQLEDWISAQRSPPIVSIPLATHSTNLRNRLPSTSGDKKCFVYLGTLAPRKNIELLIRVWDQLSQTDLSAELILVGAVDGDFQLPDVLPEGIHHRPGATDEEVSQLLRSATALVLPSWTEGFGLPVVEALSLGVPVICPDLPALREVGGGIPTFISPTDIAGWHKAICEFSGSSSAELNRQQSELKHFRPNDWSTHFSRLYQELRKIT